MKKIKYIIRIILSVFLFTLIGLIQWVCAETLHDEMDKLERNETTQAQVEIIERPRVEYNAEGLRDPFEALIAKPIIPESPQPQEETFVPEATLPSLTVQGTIWGGRFPQAIINNQVVKVGDTVEEAQIISIEKNGITVLFKDKQFYLSSPGIGQTSKKKSEGG